ncbi:MAG: hypothetical protein HFJ33_05595 [Clostridia bacterium]|nr:hypothetical protein [Clostridia bacterium]
MKEEEIRKRYQREDESDLRGTNVGAMDRFIAMLQLHEKSEDLYVRNMGENFEYIDQLSPNFVIFQGKECLFMHNFKAYQISENTDMLVATHEFGHAVLSIMNDTVVPEDYGKIIARAKQYAISPENKENFKDYIQYLSGKNDRKEDRTEAEKGPVSDIISSIFQLQGLRIGTADNICIFPSSHPREYYYDEEKGQPNLKNIFDEDFANYYALKVNNCTKELKAIRDLFGDEFVHVLDTELKRVSERLSMVKESEMQESLSKPIEQIKSVVVFSRQGEIQEITPLGKMAEREEREQ